MANVYIGMSGWTHEPWRGSFYPKGLTHKKELEYASRKVNSIEINGTFYSLQKPHSFQKWYNETPDDFVFAVKGNQFITHVRRLKDVKEPLCNFMASGLLCLKEKMGPLLWQFPPNVMLKDDRFEAFLKMLPHDSKAAAKLAKQHTAKVEGRSYTKADGDYPIRHAFEFRHPSFANEEFLELLREHNVALVLAHSGLKWDYLEELTADFIYARMHGQEAKYKKGYPPPFLKEWAQKVKGWSRKRDCYIYFDTEAKDHAPNEAMALKDLLD
ncbi:MAG: DUF72 domain-containing protein [Bdellovibrionales bacterium]